MGTMAWEWRLEATICHTWCGRAGAREKLGNPAWTSVGCMVWPEWGLSLPWEVTLRLVGITRVTRFLSSFFI